MDQFVFDLDCEDIVDDEDTLDFMGKVKLIFSCLLLWILLSCSFTFDLTLSPDFITAQSDFQESP